MGGGSQPARRRRFALAALSCVAFVGWAVAGGTGSPADDTQKELVRLTQRFLQAVASGDTGYLRSSVYPEAQFVFVEKKADGASIESTSTARLLEAAPQWKSRVQERIGDPRVMVDGRMGIVWARYVYHVDGKLSHCGTDLFTFMQTDTGWLLSSASWTVEREGCEETSAPQP